MTAAAFFDLDKTLWACSGEKAFAGLEFRRGKLGAAQLAGVLYQYFRYELGLIGDVDTLKRHVLRSLFAGEEVGSCLEVYAEHFYAHLSGLLYPDMLARACHHKNNGDKIVIVSAALDFIAAPVAELINADRCFATELEIIGQHFSGQVRGPIHYGENKAAIIKGYAAEHGLDLSQCHAYGDHWEDRHMLAAVGCPVAVNPDRRLARLAQSRQWPTLVLPSPQ
jgi:HAD superfamily hydrolase (TIGR01490 family)